MEWKWTHGGPYVKSKRQYNSNNTSKDDINHDVNDAKFNKEIEKSAYTTALNHDENTWDILNNIQITHSQQQHLPRSLFYQECMLLDNYFLPALFCFCLKLYCLFSNIWIFELKRKKLIILKLSNKVFSFIF